MLPVMTNYYLCPYKISFDLYYILVKIEVQMSFGKISVLKITACEYGDILYSTSCLAKARLML